MELNFTKIFGWVLIFAGLAVIIWPLYFSYNIFQGERKKLSPDFLSSAVFKFPTSGLSWQKNKKIC